MPFDPVNRAASQKDTCNRLLDCSTVERKSSAISIARRLVANMGRLDRTIRTFAEDHPQLMAGCYVKSQAACSWRIQDVKASSTSLMFGIHQVRRKSGQLAECGKEADHIAVISFDRKQRRVCAYPSSGAYVSFAWMLPSVGQG